MDWYLSCCGLYAHMGVCVCLSDFACVCVCVVSPLSLLQPLLSGSYQLLSQTEDRGIILHTRGAVWPAIYLPVSLSAELPPSPECHPNKNQTDKKQMGRGKKKMAASQWRVKRPHFSSNWKVAFLILDNGRTASDNRWSGKLPLSVDLAHCSQSNLLYKTSNYVCELSL